MSSNTRRRLLGFAAVLGMPGIARAQTAESPPTPVCERVQQDAGHQITYKQKFALKEGRLVVFSTNDSIVIDRPVRATFSPGYAAYVEKTTDPKVFTLRNGIALTVERPRSNISNVQFFARIKVPMRIHDVTMTYTIGNDAPKPMEYPIRVDAAPVLDHVDISFYWINPPANIAKGPVTVHLSAYGKPIGSIEFNLMRRKWKEYLTRIDAEFAARRDVAVTANGMLNIDGCYLPEALPCFFTTAAVHTLGLSNDCWELRSLRAFRDNALRQIAGGDALIRRYYTDAPEIVSAITQRQDAARIWRQAYWQYILPCATLAALRFDAMALAHYRRLVRHLARFKPQT